MHAIPSASRFGMVRFVTRALSALSQRVLHRSVVLQLQIARMLSVDRPTPSSFWVHLPGVVGSYALAILSRLFLVFNVAACPLIWCIRPVLAQVQRALASWVVPTASIMHRRVTLGLVRLE